MSRCRILVVEDRESLRKLFERALAGEGYDVATADDAPAGVRLARDEVFDLVLTDLKLPSGTGLDVLRASKGSRPQVPVVVLTAYGSVETAVEAMKEGAADFLQKPVEIDELFTLVKGLLGRSAGAPGFEVPGGPALVGEHPSFRAALRLLQRVAPTASTVLLTGESGTGKELFARAIHALSPRRAGPFVAINCAAIPEALIENELFGHEKGAFTGADRRQAGRFEQAQGGTLFLDEIGELAPGVQGKVLRVLEERCFERVGGGPTVRVDVRLVAATNRDLRAMVEASEFRSDLYFRLDVFPIALPPLRERASDVGALARHLLRLLAEKHGVAPPEIAADALELLAAHSWPGNVRELANVLERALILHEGSRLRAGDLRPHLEPLAGAGERERLKQALADADGDKRRAAESLGMSYRALLRKVKEHDLEGYPRYRA